jgi:hypothetical protein
MADATTIYDIETRYKAKDLASGTVRSMTRDVRGLSGMWDRARGSLRGFTDVWHGGQAIAAGMRGAYDGLIGFNAGLEQSKITMAGMMRLNLGGTFESHFGRATTMVNEFQQIAKKSVGTTQDFVSMAQQITRPVAAAGLSMADLRDITKGAVIASRAFGIQAEVAALDIEQAMMGMLTKRERFARALLEPMGFTTETFNKMDAQKRAEALKAALTQPAIAEMAAKQEKSFEGVVSTFQDNLQMAIGKVGLPLFEMLTAEIQEWNKWIDANADTIEDMGRTLGNAMAYGFGVVRDAVGFLVEHRKVFFALAKTFLAFQAGKAGVGIAKGVGGAVKSVTDFVKSLGGAKKGLLGLADSSQSAMSMLGGLAGKFGAAIPVIGGLIAGVGVVTSVFDEFGKAERERLAKLKSEVEKGAQTFSQVNAMANERAVVDRLRAKEERGALTTLEALDLSESEAKLRHMAGTVEDAERAIFKWAQQQGVIGTGDTIAPYIDPKTGETIGNALGLTFTKGPMADAFNENREAALQTMTLLNRIAGRFEYPSQLAEFLAGPAEPSEPERPERDLDAEFKKAIAGARMKTTVNINTIEVASADPNRFIHDFGAAIEAFNRAPGQAVTALTDGF